MMIVVLKIRDTGISGIHALIMNFVVWLGIVMVELRRPLRGPTVYFLLSLVRNSLF